MSSWAHLYPGWTGVGSPGSSVKQDSWMSALSLPASVGRRIEFPSVIVCCVDITRFWQLDEVPSSDVTCQPRAPNTRIITFNVHRLGLPCSISFLNPCLGDVVFNRRERSQNPAYKLGSTNILAFGPYWVGHDELVLLVH
jgi:hypothetical protein